MREHQAEGVEFDPSGADFAGDRGEKEPAVLVGFEQRAAGDAAVHDVMPCVGGVFSGASGHGVLHPIDAKRVVGWPAGPVQPTRR